MTIDESSIPPNLPASIRLTAQDQSNGSSHPVVIKNYIDGHFVPPAELDEDVDKIDHHQYLINRNPATGDILSYIPRSRKEDVERAVESAKRAHERGEWRLKTEEQRALALEKIADSIEANLERLAQLESLDNGKPLSLARSLDIPRAVANFRFFAGAIRHQSTDCHTMGTQFLNYTLRRPVGVCGLITPWNLPLYLLTWKVAPALAMGNTVVAKASELTPMTANALAEIIDSIPEVPKGVFNLVHGYGRECGSAIVENDDVSLVSFTGGTATGRVVGRVATEKFKKVSLELGGKNPMLVFDDCDLELAVNTAKRAAFSNQGEICLCCSRILVQEGIYDEFVKRFVALVQQIKVGDPNEASTDMGPVISQEHRTKIEFYIELAQREGGRIAVGGKRPSDPKCSKGAFIEPTVVLDLPIDSRTSTEEVFGPLVTIHKFKTEEEAIKMANCVKYGLCASVMTTNLGRAHRVADLVEAGMIWTNCWLVRDLRTPFHGVKHSGVGVEGGHYSLDFYSEQKNVCIKL